MSESAEDFIDRRDEGDELARRLQQRYTWWSVGAFMDSHGLSASDARKVIEVSGHVLMKGDQALYRMHRTYKRLRKAGIFEAEARGCPMVYARHCAGHYEDGRIDRGGLRTLLTARSCRVGDAPLFNQIEDDPTGLLKQLSDSEL
jgi:hypothetical protein